jgi:selenocysteine lyase/cysteine desulfurase
MDAAVRYLETLGRSIIQRASGAARDDLRHTMSGARAYEEMLSREMLRILRDADAAVYGIAEENRTHERVPTFCFNLPNIPPAKVSEELARRNIGVRDGHMYSPRLMRRLGLSTETGAVRASLVHYNTVREIHDFGSALAEIRKSC